MMLCVHCNTYRPEGEGPCPYCGGPASAWPANGVSGNPGSGIFSTGSGHTTVAMPPLGSSFAAPSGSGTGTEWQAQSLSSYQAYQQSGQAGQPGPGSGVNYPGASAATGSDVSYPALSSPGFSYAGLSGSGTATVPFGSQSQSPLSGTGEAVPQEPFPPSQQQFPAAPLNGSNGQGQQTGFHDPLQAQGQGQGQQTMAMLPVLYQDPANPSTQSLILIPQAQGVNTGALLPLSQQVPGPPIAGIPTEEEALYIPPMYTKPRPVIPRYRAISGFLSFIIVMLLLCSGAAYYAKVTGKLAFLGQLMGMAPPSLQATPIPNLPDPKPSENGPAYGVISSATTAPSVDPKTGIALQPSQVFKPGQTIYLTYSVHAKKAGTVTVKWYTNGLLYQVLSKNTPDPKGGSWTGVSMMRFTQPLEGMVELYWNDTGKPPQLAIRLYFVVRP